MNKVKDGIFLNMKQLSIVILCCIPAASMGSNSYETKSTVSVEGLRITHMTVADGLSDTATTSVVQDHQGFMWFGTPLGGLNRYDGYEFKIYQNEQDNERSISQNYVTVLFIDSQGTLWIGTNGGGLNRYNRQTDDFTRFCPDPNDSSTLVNGTINAICQDLAGALWIGTEEGLCRMDIEIGKFLTYRHDPQNPQSLSDNTIESLYTDPQDGKIWVGTRRSGICVFDPAKGQFKSYRPDPSVPGSLSGDKVLCFQRDNKGLLWIGTSFGLNRFMPETETFVSYLRSPTDANTISDNHVWAIYEDRVGRFWIGTATGLNLMERSRGTFRRVYNDRGDPEALKSTTTIIRIYEDNQGGIWAMSNEEGINRLAGEREKKFMVYRNIPNRRDSLAYNFVLGIYVDINDRVWISTVGGVDYINPGNPVVEHIRFPGDKSHTIYSVAQGEDGTLWVGGFPGALFRIKDGKFTHYVNKPQDSNSPAANNIWDVIADDKGGVWIVYWAAGVDYFDGKTFTHYKVDPSNPQSLPSGRIYDWARDKNGKIWLASEGGLIMLDPTTAIFTTYLIEPGKPQNQINRTIRSVYADQEDPGEIWVGTLSGLLQFDPVAAKFGSLYRKKDGLPSETVQSIQRDDQGCLWLGTIAGLCRFDPERGTFRNYDISDGLAGNKFYVGAAAKSSQGWMFFGSTEGLVTFRPDQMQDNPYPPKVVLTGFELFNKPVSIGGEKSLLNKAINVAEEITLTHHQNMFTFKFAAMNFTASEKSQYAYKMDGFDDNWRYTGAKRRFATYTRLAPGHYAFRVKASNNDGVWNEQGASIKIVVLPPWWATWWFRGVAVATLLALLIVGYRWRISNIEQRSQDFERQVAERTAQLEVANKELESFAYSVSHDLRAPLRHIDGFVELLQKRMTTGLDERSRHYIDTISDSVKRMSILIDDLLSFSQMGRHQISKQHVDLGKLTQEIIQEFETETKNRNICWICVDLPIVFGDRAMLHIVLFNLISNALKFTRPRQEAKIEIGSQPAQDSETVIFVRDNGVGFDMNYSDKLFDVFQRLHGIDEFEGSGIGLANVRRIITRHRGRTWAESKVDKGATFYFSLPRT